MEETISLVASKKTERFSGNVNPDFSCTQPVIHKVKNAFKMGRFGAVAGLAYGYFIKTDIDIPLINAIITSLTIGYSLGLVLGLIEEFILFNKFKRRPMYSLLITRTIIYAATVFTCLVIFISISRAIALDYSFSQAVEEYVKHEMFRYDFMFSIATCFVINFIMQIDKFFGPGVFRKLLSGKYHSPREEERIFMFIDMKGSTGMAEKLGDLKFSYLLQDFFYDVNQAISYTNGEIYQYVGDEVVVSWPIHKKLNKEKCIECFFLIENILNNKKSAYYKQYQVVPEFKAGVHYGKVIAAWVGELKKEIVYHGDVLNTTARILSQCKELKHNLLISEELYNLLDNHNDYNPVNLKDIFLRGKEKPINLVAFSI